jgi:lipopolysaccharide biosynthesis glycosyltransferase
VTEDLLKDGSLEALKSKLSGANHLNIVFRSSGGHQIATAKPWAEITGYSAPIAVERVLTASICHEYDEAVYVDADCIFVRDATNLIEHPLYGNSKIVAMPEYSFISERDLNAPERAYFNNGVFITDLNFWRDNNIEELLVNWMVTKDTGQGTEQTAMNAILFDYWFPLSPNFNYFDNFVTEQVKSSYPNPVLVHFVGPLKPWNSMEDHTIMKRGPHDRLWKYMYRKLWGKNVLFSSKN